MTCLFVLGRRSSGHNAIFSRANPSGTRTYHWPADRTIPIVEACLQTVPVALGAKTTLKRRRSWEQRAAARVANGLESTDNSPTSTQIGLGAELEELRRSPEISREELAPYWIRLVIGCAGICSRVDPFQRIRLGRNAGQRGAAYLPAPGLPAARRRLQRVSGPALRFFGWRMRITPVGPKVEIRNTGPPGTGGDSDSSWTRPDPPTICTATPSGTMTSIAPARVSRRRLI